MESRYNKIHPKFKLNGTSYQFNELKEVARDLIKEGKLYEQAIGGFLAYWLDNKPTLEVKTSGSTRAPENVLLQKAQMVNSALATGEHFDLKPGNVSLLCLPADYIAGKMMLVRAMVLGLEIDCVEPSSTPLAGLSKDYDFAAMVPLQLEESLDEIERVKTLIVGGTTISRILQKKIQRKSTAIFETYGMTETITHVAVRSVRLSAVDAQIQSHFKALPNALFTKDDRDCLVISAPKVIDNPVVTNDIVNLISETEFELLGRYDNIINSGGIKLVPEQIEAKLTFFLSNKFFVTGLLDDKLGQKLVLVVEGEVDSEKLLKKIIGSDKFEKYEIPKSIYVLSKFIETATGKIRRKENIEILDL